VSEREKLEHEEKLARIRSGREPMRIREVVRETGEASPPTKRYKWKRRLRKGGRMKYGKKRAMKLEEKKQTRLSSTQYPDGYCTQEGTGIS